MPPPTAVEAAPVEKRSRTLPILLIVGLLLAAVAVVTILALRHRGAATTADARIADAAIVAPPVDAPVIADAPLPVPPPVPDAAPEPAVDARTGRMRDAAAPPPRPDAHPQFASTPDAGEVAKGTAYYTATANPFCHVVIDGVDHGSTPRFDKPIPSGRHHFVLTDGSSGTTVQDKTVTLAPGDHFTIAR